MNDDMNFTVSKKKSSEPLQYSAQVLCTTSIRLFIHLWCLFTFLELERCGHYC